jgi:lysine-specific demethylase 8
MRPTREWQAPMSRGEETVMGVRRVEASEVRRPFADTSPPTVVVGMVNNWPTLRRWTLRRLRDLAGETFVNVRGRYAPISRMRLREYVDLLDAAERGADWTDLHANFRSLPKDVRPYVAHQDAPKGTLLGSGAELSRLFPRRHLKEQLTFWLGPEETHTHLHYDEPANVFAQLEGRKKFTLFSPKQTRLLYPVDIMMAGTRPSRVDFSAPNVALYPLYAEVRPTTVILEPGDVLFLPPRWWHAVTTLERSLSINLWAASPSSWFRSAAIDSLKRVAHRANLYARNRCLCHGHCFEDVLLR